jgi:hypothetical protein
MEQGLPPTTTATQDSLSVSLCVRRAHVDHPQSASRSIEDFLCLLLVLIKLGDQLFLLLFDMIQILIDSVLRCLCFKNFAVEGRNLSEVSRQLVRRKAAARTYWPFSTSARSHCATSLAAAANSLAWSSSSVAHFFITSSIVFPRNTDGAGIGGAVVAFVVVGVAVAGAAVRIVGPAAVVAVG